MIDNDISEDNKKLQRERLWLIISPVIMGILSLFLVFHGQEIIKEEIVKPIDKIYEIPRVVKDLLTDLKASGGKEEAVNSINKFIESHSLEVKNTYNDIFDKISLYISIVLALFGCAIAILFTATIQFYSSSANLRRVVLSLENNINNHQKETENHQGKVYDLIKNLESRHNIIQSGTDYGRVLALRDFRHVGLEKLEQNFYKNFFNKTIESQDFNILSVLCLERAEELLTSEKYMDFFVKRELPKGGYFRLIIADKPKHYEGLSAFVSISQKLGYKSHIMPKSCWVGVCKPFLVKNLNSHQYYEFCQLLERNVEIGLEGLSVSETLSRESHIKYTGRIGKPEAELDSKSDNIVPFDNFDIKAKIKISSDTMILFMNFVNLFIEYEKEFNDFENSHSQVFLKNRFNSPVDYSYEIEGKLKNMFGHS